MIIRIEGHHLAIHYHQKEVQKKRVFEQCGSKIYYPYQNATIHIGKQ